MTNIEFKIKEVTNTNDYGEFVIEPLEPGFGYTIGNALRRVLYTSIPGAAVTSIRISGVKHKFSTLPGLKENIVDLLLNIKMLHFQLSDTKDSATVKISVKGPRDVTGEDLELPDGVELMNKDLYLGGMSGEKSKLEMELTIEKGYGYSLSEERKSLGIDSIPVDAIYSPVKRVNYTVEATRVGQQTNLDRLILKIWTNGTVNPRTALDQSAGILATYFGQIHEPKETVVSESPASTSNISAQTLQLTIDELDLPTRIYNSLRNGGIETVEDLLGTPRKDLVSMRNMGGKSIKVIEDKLREKGISLTI